MLDWITIDLDEGREWGECAMCDQERRLTHAVAWCCGPTHDEIGDESSEYPGCEVGGMCVCKPCHDKHYNMT